MSEIKLYWTKRLAVYIFGVILMSIGVAFVIQAGIGVAPGSVISYAASKLTIFSVGICTSIFYVLCVLIQFSVIRRLTANLVLQLPITIVFGQLIDLFLWLLPITPDNLFLAILLLCAGNLLFSLGIRAIAGANLVLMPPDNMARTVGAMLGWSLAKAKLIFDIIFTTTAALMMFGFSGDVFSVVGIGTIICAIGTGPSIGLFTKLMPFLDVAQDEQDELIKQNKVSEKVIEIN